MKTPSPVEFQLLALVAIREQTGREIAKLYRQETGTDISYGTLYTTFRRLKDQGWVKSRDDEDQDGRVRYFHITASGSRALVTARQHFATLARLGLVGEGASGS